MLRLTLDAHRLGMPASGMSVAEAYEDAYLERWRT
jgi:hypothetical protein